jgi:glycosyltransferase involved in cell wall biosynthesis
VLRNPELAHRLAANAHHESQKYTWEVVREQWLKVYRELARSQESGVRSQESGVSN